MIDLNKSQIQDCFDLQTAARAIENAYIASAEGRVQAPPVTYLGFEDANGDCHVKTGHVQGTEGFVIKVATGFYDNPAKGLPSSNGLNLMFSATTGAPLAILRDEGWLTDMRTGLGGAIASRALGVDGFKGVLIVGTGLQCRFQARCLQALIPERKLSFTICGRDAAKAETACAELQGDGLSANTATDLEAATRAAQVVITTTPAKMPLIQREWVTPGTHITAVGADSPGKQELATDLVAAADLLVCDLAAQSLHHGEFARAEAEGRRADEVIALGHILSGAHPGRADNKQITIADLTGLAVQDAAISLAVLEARNTEHSSN
ncbi:ornithine cyclodeaminase family protein [Sulfitobacter delicatus]|uniref:Ornithine cyclodeaminase n=1 Tax=Sulfitobacter delicatus TaxID=218672 RepID=A0A1G7T998_9RHOB|nr:ornithine cyclodeaminase family protein [Sulfitobacter delicatus]SDG31848.1 ornithine cyclodeaminase [Sulfitobacter delicatus]